MMLFHRHVANSLTATLFGLIVQVHALSAQASGWKEQDDRVSQLYKEGKYIDAIPLAEEAVRAAEAKFGPEHPNVATSLNHLSQLYAAEARYAEAEPLFQRALAIRERALGNEHPDVATSLNNIANLYSAQGRYAQAGPLYERALRIRLKVLGTEDPHVAESWNDLATLYQAEGKYAEAEPVYKRALAMRLKLLGPEHEDVAESRNNLASLYQARGKHSDAEALYQQALAAWEKVLGTEHPAVATALNNLAGLYQAEGKYKEAEPLYQRALQIRITSLGRDHPDIATNLNNLGSLYLTEHRYSDALQLFQQALTIQKKVLGNDHPDLANTVNNVGGIYLNAGKYAEAEPLFQRALAIWDKAFGSESRQAAAALSNLAECYQGEGKYAEAEPVYRRALVIREKTLGKNHPDVAIDLSNLAGLAYANGKYDEAESLFERFHENLRGQFQQSFAYMSESDRLSFLATVGRAFPFYLSFCLTYRDRDPRLVGKMYDTVLWEKGLVATSIGVLRRTVAASGDQEAVALLHRLMALRTQWASLHHSLGVENAEQWFVDVRHVEQQINNVETTLARRFRVQAEEKNLAPSTWQAVQQVLKPGDAAIEFVRFPYHDGKQWTGKTYYVALILTPDTKTVPILAELGEAAKLENEPIVDYRHRVENVPSRGAGLRFYEAFWKPLESHLRACKRAYISTDGILNEISFVVVPTEDGGLLLDKYDLRPLMSTKDLLHPKPVPRTQSAVLIGNPKFDLTEAQQREAVHKLGLQQSHTVPPSTKTGDRALQFALSLGPAPALRTLPGTEVELESVGSLLTKRGWNIQVYAGDAALVEVLKRVQAPRVLHIATHSFFEPDMDYFQEALGSSDRERLIRSGSLYRAAGPEDLMKIMGALNHPDLHPELKQELDRMVASDPRDRNEVVTIADMLDPADRSALAALELSIRQSTPRILKDPMLKSGLYFAGADRALSGNPPRADLDNGILTSYEATAVDLAGTELVVLSACETGLGTTQNGEGVFGLRRALQEAGAQSVLMSMWSVPDTETRELMTTFYQEWLSGKEKHQALHDAQLAMRKKTKARWEGEDRPYYWGAFVLVGQ